MRAAAVLATGTVKLASANFTPAAQVANFAKHWPRWIELVKDVRRPRPPFAPRTDDHAEFDIRQDEKIVIVDIRVWHVRADDMEDFYVMQ